MPVPMSRERMIRAATANSRRLQATLKSSTAGRAPVNGRASSAQPDGIIRTSVLNFKDKTEWSVEEAADWVAQARGYVHARALHHVIEALLEGRLRAYGREQPDVPLGPDDLRRRGVVWIEMGYGGSDYWQPSADPAWKELVLWADDVREAMAPGGTRGPAGAPGNEPPLLPHLQSQDYPPDTWRRRT